MKLKMYLKLSQKVKLKKLKLENLMKKLKAKKEHTIH
jgi:hypothetical protein